MDKFDVALKKAEQSSEAKVLEYLKEQGYKDIKHNEDGRYDFIYLNHKGQIETVEVKEDKQWNKTGNIAIEYRSRGKASGISTSKADIWLYMLNQLYQCPTGELRAYLIQHWDRCRRVKGGDDKTSDLVLLKIDDFLDIFKPT